MRTFTRISIATGTAALCLGIASPAMACLAPDTGVNPAHSTSSADPLTGSIAKADRSIAGQLSNLDHWKAKIAADPNLTATQKADLTAAVDAARAALAAEKMAVDSATTPEDVQAALQSAPMASSNAAFTLVESIVRANDWIAGEQSGLTKFGAKVASDTTSTAAQEADVASMIHDLQTQLASERANVNSATTVDEVHTALTSAAVQLAESALSRSLAIAYADNQLAAISTKLASWVNQIAADPNLSADQKMDLTAKVTAEQAKIVTLKSKVDAATSARQVRSLMRAAQLFDGSWKHCDPSGQENGAAALHQKKVASAQSAKHAQQPANGQQRVVLTAKKSGSAGAHRAPSGHASSGQASSGHASSGQASSGHASSGQASSGHGHGNGGGRHGGHH
jgi:hypothetical protein